MRGLLTIAAILCTPGLARAEAPAVPLDATADVLFEYARSLVRDGRYAEACPKFEESMRIRPGIGTRFNLADCWERQGRLASAWAAFVKVSTETHVLAQKEREEAARDRARTLEPRLGRLAIDVPQERDVTVRCDGQPVSTNLWSLPIPMDAGKHFVEVIAGRQIRWSAVVVVEDGQVSRVTAPAGDALVTPVDAPTSAEKQPAVSPSTHLQRTLGWTLLGSSVLGFGAGLLGIVEHDRAVADYNADPTCPSFDASSRPAPCQDRVSAATTWKTAAVVGFAGGGLLLGAGAVLLLTAPSSSSPSHRVACVPAGLGATCGGAF